MRPERFEQPERLARLDRPERLDRLERLDRPERHINTQVWIDPAALHSLRAAAPCDDDLPVELVRALKRWMQERFSGRFAEPVLRRPGEGEAVTLRIPAALYDDVQGVLAAFQSLPVRPRRRHFRAA